MKVVKDCVRVLVTIGNGTQREVYGWVTREPNLVVTPLVERFYVVGGKYVITHVPTGMSIISTHTFTSIDRAQAWANQFEGLVPDELGRCITGPFADMLIKAVQETWGVKVRLSAFVARGGTHGCD